MGNNLNSKINREWIEIYDSESKTTWLFDKDFLLSNWHCIYGNGCKGVLDFDASELNQGCCSHGAHFSDKKDLKKVQKVSKRLNEDIWQFKSVGESKGIFKSNKQNETKTRLVENGCIFLNRNGFKGGAGCALHLLSMAEGNHHSLYKPDVCWQLPLRKEEFELQAGGTLVTIKAWERSDWGDGGDDFHWWCTQDDLAYTSAARVYSELEPELILLCGKEIYLRLKEAFDEIVQNLNDNNKYGSQKPSSRRSRVTLSTKAKTN